MTFAWKRGFRNLVPEPIFPVVPVPVVPEVVCEVVCVRPVAVITPLNAPGSVVPTSNEVLTLKLGTLRPLAGRCVVPMVSVPNAEASARAVSPDPEPEIAISRPSAFGKAMVLFAAKSAAAFAPRPVLTAQSALSVLFQRRV